MFFTGTRSMCVGLVEAAIALAVIRTNVLLDGERERERRAVKDDKPNISIFQCSKAPLLLWRRNDEEGVSPPLACVSVCLPRARDEKTDSLFGMKRERE